MRAGIVLLALLANACATAPEPVVPTAIEAGAPQWLAEREVASIAIAYIADGRVAWTAAYGEQSAGVPATPETLYNVASLAQPISAEVMLRLASQNRVSLDEPMSRHWVDPDIANDPRRDLLTLRIALSHRTGFPNWRRMTNGVLTIQSEPGAAFTSAGEGYEYARRYTQAASGEPFEHAAQRLVFDPIGMRNTAYTRRDWFAGRIAVPHGEDGAANEPDINDGEMLASDDLYTTVGDYARFVIAVMNHESVSPEIARQRLQYEIELRDGGCGGENGIPMDACPLGVGMGMGWMVFRYEGETVITHSGSDHGEQTLAFFVPERRIGVVIFTNSANGRRVFPDIVAQLYPNEDFLTLLRLQAR
ncbi:MAG: serine hydrolase domain-containing protein [Terricaulis sp.]